MSRPLIGSHVSPAAHRGPSPLAFLLLLTGMVAGLAAAPAFAHDAGDTATVEARNVEMAERFLTQVYVERDFDAIPDYIAEDFVDHSPGAPPDARGPGFVRRQAESTRAVFPDFSFETLHTVAQGDLVALHWKMTGTSSEAMAGPGAAGKAVEVEGISLFRYDDEGKVVESWDLVDRAGMLQQVGFEMRPPGGGAPQSEDPGAGGEDDGE